MPFLHGAPVSVLAGAVPHVTAVILAAGAGAWLHAHRHPVIVAPAGPDGPAAEAWSRPLTLYRKAS